MDFARELFEAMSSGNHATAQEVTDIALLGISKPFLFNHTNLF